MLISLDYLDEWESRQRPGYRVDGPRFEFGRGERFFFSLPQCIPLALGSAQPQWATGEPSPGTKWPGPVPRVYTTRRYTSTFQCAFMTCVLDTVQLH